MEEEIAAAHSSTKQPVSRQKDRMLILTQAALDYLESDDDGKGARKWLVCE